MRRHVLWYGLAAGLLIVLFRLVEYRWLVLTHSFELYGALLAIIFAAVGIWVGLRLTTPKVVVEERIVLREVPGTVPQAPATDFSRDDDQVAALGVTPRELEILGLLAEGLSNREIAERLYIAQADLPEGEARIPLKAVHLNRCPALVELRHVSDGELDRFGLDRTRCLEHAALLAGFAWYGLTEVPFDSNASALMQTFYLVVTTLIMGLELLTVVNATLCAILGPGLALRGPDGSMHNAVQGMTTHYRFTLTCFSLGLICFMLSALLYSWMQFDWTLALPCTLLIGV